MVKKTLLVLTLAGLLSSCAVVDGLNQGLSQINQELGKLSVATKYSDKEISVLKKKYVQNGYWNIPALCENSIKYADYYYNFLISPLPNRELEKKYANDVKYGSTNDIVETIIKSGVNPKLKGYIRTPSYGYQSYFFYPRKSDYDKSLSTTAKLPLPTDKSFLGSMIDESIGSSLNLKRGFNDLGVVSLNFGFDPTLVVLAKSCQFGIEFK